MKRRLLYFSLILCLVLATGSCKKLVEKVKTDAAIKAIISGKWKVTSFTVDGADSTAAFSNYLFQFYENETVDAINSGTVERTGSWSGDIGAMTITSLFSNANNPLLLLNGTFYINESSLSYVIASQVGGTQNRVMRLDKQ